MEASHKLSRWLVRQCSGCPCEHWRQAGSSGKVPTWLHPQNRRRLWCPASKNCGEDRARPRCNRWNKICFADDRVSPCKHSGTGRPRPNLRTQVEALAGGGSAPLPSASVRSLRRGVRSRCSASFRQLCLLVLELGGALCAPSDWALKAARSRFASISCCCHLDSRWLKSARVFSCSSSCCFRSNWSLSTYVPHEVRK